MSSYLPQEIIVNILSRLPVKSILRFRCVCKSWRYILNSSSNPNFVKIHLNHAVETNNFSVMLSDEDLSLDDRNCLLSVDYESLTSCDERAVERIDYPFKSRLNRWVTILGSCNGLVCIEPDRNGICIFNPVTKEYQKLPTAPIESKRGVTEYSSYGFGYDCKIDDYKLVKIGCFDEQDISEVSVYTLGSNSWKRIQNIPYDFSTGRVAGVLVNEALHWIATPHIGSETSEVIVSFDVSDERFQAFQLPNSFRYMLDTEVGVLGWSLCVLGNLLDDRFDVWVMRDYGVVESWTKIFTIPQHTGFHYLRSIKSFKNGEILFHASSLEDGHALVSYDSTHERTRILQMPCIPLEFDADTYMPSLVSLNSGTYLGQEQIPE